MNTFTIVIITLVSLIFGVPLVTGGLFSTPTLPIAAFVIAIIIAAGATAAPVVLPVVGIFYLIIILLGKALGKGLDSVLMNPFGALKNTIGALLYPLYKVVEFIFYSLKDVGSWMWSGKRPTSLDFLGKIKYVFQISLIGICIAAGYIYYLWVKGKFLLPGNLASINAAIKNQQNIIKNMDGQNPPASPTETIAAKKKLEKLIEKKAYITANTKLGGDNITEKSTTLDKIINTIALTGIGMLTLALFTQFNGFDVPIQPMGQWPLNGWDDKAHKWSSFKILFKAGLGAVLFSLLGKYIGGSEKNTVSAVGGILGFLAGLMLNFKTSTRALGYHISSYLSILLKIFLVIVVILVLIWLIQKYSILSSSLSVIFILISAGLLLFTLFNFLYKNPSFRKFIRSNALARILFYTIFIIPCLVTSLFGGAWDEALKTPRYVYMILLVETIILALYFLIPILIQKLYLHRPLGTLTGRKVDINTHLTTLHNKVNIQQHKINKLKNALPGLNWNEIWLPKSGTAVSPEHKAVMQDKLAQLGYKTDGSLTCPPTIDDTYYNRGKNLLGLVPKCSIESAIKYIHDTQPTIIKEQKHFEIINDRYTDLQYEYNNLKSIFDTKQLINRPVPTDKLLTKTDWHYENLKRGTKNYNYIYSLSSWIYIHQSASNANYKNNLYTKLINYGDKPNISYRRDIKTLQITVQTKKKSHKVIYKTTKFPLQKWNNIVMNFDAGTLDVFINNKLVATEKNIIPFISSDAISIGEEGGIGGGICNTVYYPNTLGKTKMYLFYNTLKLKNPPVL